MNSLKSKIWHFLVDEQGPTAVEYAIMLALIIMVCIATIAQVGTNTSDSLIPVRNVLAGP